MSGTAFGTGYAYMLLADKCWKQAGETDDAIAGSAFAGDLMASSSRCAAAAGLLAAAPRPAGHLAMRGPANS